MVGCAFWRNDIRSFYEPTAPPIEARLNAIRQLVKYGVDVELRIDPLFPSTRVVKTIRMHKPLSEYGIPEAQTMEDIQALAKFAKESGVSSIIAKPLKVRSQRKLNVAKIGLKPFTAMQIQGKGRNVRGGSWRLPENYQKALLSSVSQACKSIGINFKHCMHDVMTRK